ncbi:MAG: PQQ-dependent sugar dehydrogenase [Opitutaceae bacterium]|nr:PQQ-dependent sugar dehydrogenase [Opitutaceae bacterium]
MRRPTLRHLAAFLATFVSLSAQPLARVAANSLRLPASEPAMTYSTTRAFPSLSFSQPLALVTPPGETRRLFVVEKTGRIFLIPDATAASPTRTLFLDLSSRVATSTGNDERGLLALAFHPQYAANGQFYVWYTLNTSTAAGTGLHDRLARFRVSAGDPNAADPGSEQPLITQYDEAANHNGGELLFGSDGYLYLSIGDEGGGNDQFQNSQRIDRDFFSGILRLDVDQHAGSLPPSPHPAVHAGTYAIPPDNPFVGVPTFNGATVNPVAGRGEFWAVGLRNPWRMSFDPATGRLWCADVGQNAREEINVIVRGGNYGWNYREGNIAGPRGAPPAGANLVPPIWDYNRPEGQSVTGGIVYRGSRIPSLAGSYLFADFVTGRIWALRPHDDQPVGAERVQLLTTDGGISSFGLDPSNGDVLLADLTEGAIKRLVATSVSGSPGFPATLSATGAFTSIANLTSATGLVGYAPNVTAWNDHAAVRRWFGLTDNSGTFRFSTEGAWGLPVGAVWIQHFDLPLERSNPASARRVETRFLVKTSTGAYGITYRWNESGNDATLVPEEGADAVFTITENGRPRTQTWRFPGRTECMTCHTEAGGYALGFNTRQLNREHAFANGSANIIQALAGAGYLDTRVPPPAASLPALPAVDDVLKPIELRARAFLDVNCSHCHQPGASGMGSWDARASTPLSLAGIINGPVLDNGGDPASRVLVPGEVLHSKLHLRLTLRGPRQMPPLAINERDFANETLIEQWIAALAVPQAPSRLINLAARAQVGTGASVLTAGFVIGPGSGKQVLIRAAGPALGASPFNVPGTLSNPTLTVFGPDSSTQVVARNDDWHAAPNVAELRPAVARVGAFAFADTSSDAALLATLSPGAYTAQATGMANGTGVALVEVYDADPSFTAASSRFTNASIRAQVGVEAGILIPGLVVGPGAARTVLIRAVGPGLRAFGVDGFLNQPVVTLFSGNQRFLANTRWNTAPNAADIRAMAERVGAFALAEGGADSALLATLSSGDYTIQVSGADNGTGIVLVEIYEVP